MKTKIIKMLAFTFFILALLYTEEGVTLQDVYIGAAFVLAYATGMMEAK